MSRRRGITWAATSVPEIRRKWCNTLDHTVERFKEPQDKPLSADRVKVWRR